MPPLFRVVSGQIHPIVAERAENATVWDVDGREYIDFAGGIAVLNTGHLHPKVIAAVQEQLTKLTHTCFQVLAYEPYIALCEEIAKRVPGDFAKKTLLVTSGSEAVENAVKIARAATWPRRRDRLHRRLPRPHHDDPEPDRQSGSLFRRHGPDAGRCVPRPGTLPELHGISEDESIASIERIFKNDAQPQ